MLSDDKISHISHVLLSGLKQKGCIKLKAQDAAVRKEIKRIFYSKIKLSEEIDAIVRRKISSLSKTAVEGGQEWEVLYRKYYEEEELRKGLA
ncbi:protein of unknown function DUF507 [Candidatus Magnetoovum chiemensis]|nr:protein of unknown function DUF507 [Candidatus Magnetoovum chiemensis]